MQKLSAEPEKAIPLLAMLDSAAFHRAMKGGSAKDDAQDLVGGFCSGW